VTFKHNVVDESLANACQPCLNESLFPFPCRLSRRALHRLINGWSKWPRRIAHFIHSACSSQTRRQRFTPSSSSSSSSGRRGSPLSRFYRSFGGALNADFYAHFIARKNLLNGHKGERRKRRERDRRAWTWTRTPTPWRAARASRRRGKFCAVRQIFAFMRREARRRQLAAAAIFDGQAVHHAVVDDALLARVAVGGPLFADLPAGGGSKLIPRLMTGRKRVFFASPLTSGRDPF